MNVLIVDDHPTNRKLLRAVLEAEGVAIREAADGREALAALETHAVDAIISDILMPNMDGYRLCHEVRCSPRFRHLPFIFYTNTFNSPGDEKLAREMGGDAFIAKPARAERILRVLHEICATPRPVAATGVTAPSDLDLMKLYSEQLVAKLEERNAELEPRTAELEREITGRKLLQRTAQENLEFSERSRRALLSMTEDQQRSGTALRQSEGRFRRIMESDMFGMIFWDAAGNITEANDVFLRLVGYTRGDFTHGRLQRREMTPPEFRKLDEHALAEIAANGACAPYEKEFFRKDGTRVPVLIGGAHFPEQSEEGVAFVLDLTARKATELALRASDQRFNDLVNSTDGIVWEADATTFVFTSISANAERLLGHPVTDWLKPGFWAEHIHPDDRERAVQFCAACTGRAEDHDFEYRFTTADGGVRWLRDIVRVV